MPRARPEHPTPGIARCPWPCSTTALVAANPSAANTGQGNLPRANKWENSNNVFLVANSASAAAQKSLPPPQPIAGRAIYVADPATMRPRQLWCALVGCPENVARGGVTPEGQELPEWLTWSEFVTTIDGRQVSTGEIVNLPLTYYGPSIPLGDGWQYGGSTSPAATSTSSGGAEGSTTTSASTTTSESGSSSSSSSESGSSSSSLSSSGSSSSSSSSLGSSSSSSPSSSSSSTTSPSPSSSQTSSTTSPTSSSTTQPPSSTSRPPSTTPSTTPSMTPPTTPPTISRPPSSISPIPSSSASIAPPSHHSSNRTLAIVLPSVLVPIALLILLALLLWWLLRKKRERNQERRLAAFRSSGANWSAVPTADPAEKTTVRPPAGPAPAPTGGPPGFSSGLPAGAASTGNLASGHLAVPAAGAGLAAGAAGGTVAAAGADAAGVGAYEGSKRDSGSSGATSVGDESSALLGSRAGSRPASSVGSRGGGSGLAGIGAGVAGALGGIGLLRGLGMGRRPSGDTLSSERQASGERSVSGNTMEKMIGVFKPSSRSGTRSGSGDTTTTTTDKDVKRSSGGTSSGVYAAVPEEDLFFNVPRPIMDRSGSGSEKYFSAESDPGLGSDNRRGGRFVDPGSTSSSGSRTTSSLSSGRSHGSRSSGSKGSHGGFRGAGGRVHSTIPEEALVAGAAGAAGAAVGAAVAGAHYGESDLSLQSAYSSQSHYDSAGSGSNGSREAAKEVDVGEFGGRVGPVGKRRVRVTPYLPPSTRNSFTERNASVGTFGTPFDQGSLASSEFLTAPAGRTPTPGAPDAPRPSTDSFGAPVTGHKRSASAELIMAAASEAVKRKRSGSYDRAMQRSGSHDMTMQRSASHDRPAHRRTESEDPQRKTPSPAKHSRNASHSLVAPPPGIKRVAPSPVGTGAGFVSGGDMMLSPFGPGSEPHTASTQPLTGSSKSQSPPHKSSRSALAMMQRDGQPVGTTSSADGAGRRGSAPRVTLYDEFGAVQDEASRSAPMLALGSRPPSAMGTMASGGTSGSSIHSAPWEETAALRGRRVSHPYVFDVGGSGASRASTRLHTRHQQREAEELQGLGGGEVNLDDDEPMPSTPQLAQQGEQGSPRTPRNVMGWLKTAVGVSPKEG